MKKIKFPSLFILFIFLQINFLNAQNSEIDSLIQLILKTEIDTVKVDALIALSARTYDNPDKQLEYLTMARQLSEKINYEMGVADSYSSLGVYYTNLGEFGSALNYLDEASDIYKKLDDKTSTVAALGNMGNVYCYQGDYNKGLECFLDALEVMYEIGDKNWIATAKNNIGSVYSLLEEDSLALVYYNEAYEIYEEIGEKNGMSLALGNLANMYNRNGETNRAIDSYKEAIEIDAETGNMEQLARNYTNIGRAYGDIDDHENAINYLEEAVGVFDYLGNKNGLANTYMNLADYYKTIGDNINAKKNLNKSLLLAKEIGAKHLQLNVYKQLAYHDSVDGNYLFALENYKMYNQLKDSIFQIEKSEQITEMQTKYDTERKEKALKLSEAENAKKDLENQRKSIVIYAGSGLVLLLLIIAVILVRTSRARKKINIQLKEKNFEINQQKEEIITQNEILHNQNINIEKSHRKITDSINYASRIQNAMLPAKLVIDQFMPENFIFFKPRDIVSGDFYWIKEVRDHLLIVAADCTGHGVPGAFVSMMGMALLNDIVRDEKITQSNQVLEELRKRVKSSLKQTGLMDEQKDGMDLALCAIDLKTERMQYSGANIPLYLFRDGELINFRPVSNPIGISHKEIPFENHEIMLKTGDKFYMFSDGLIDQFHYETKEKYKTVRFTDLIQRIHSMPMADQFIEFEKLYEEWTGSTENQTDDILVMGFKIT